FLSLEVHCSLEQQVTMAELLNSTLGDVLVTEPFMTNSFVLPSPEDLKNRILVKVKGSKTHEETLMKNDFSVMDKKASGSAGLRNPSMVLVKGLSSSSGVSTTSDSEEPGSGSGDSKHKQKKPTTKIAP